MITPNQIAEHGGVSAAYARMILAGSRKPSLALALRIYDATGAQMGQLDGLTKADIASARKLVGAS